MTQREFDLLLAYIDARIKELIARDLGRDSLYEAVETNRCRDELQSHIVKQ